ncbi:MAG: hypothetical protein EGQ17_02280, partial [Lachnospiraceae bacterium]|nr:hypothetical protein [Lachnospiraceae bacterium]
MENKKKWAIGYAVFCILYFAVSVAMPHDRLESRGLEHELLFTARSCVTFRSDHPLARKRDLTVEDLYDYPQIRTTSKMTEFCNYDATLPFDVYGSVEKN